MKTMYLHKQTDQHFAGNATVPANEAERQAKLEEYAILDTLPEDEFDSLVELAAMITGSPISLMNLLSYNRQWTKASYGMDVESSPRSESVCQYTILDQVNFEVEDLSEDERFFDMPYVKNDPNLRFYSGYPLRTTDGYNLGALCVLDTQPRSLTDKEKKGLQTIANEIVARLDLRKQQQELQRLNKEKDQFLRAVNHDIKSPLNGIVSSTHYLQNLWGGDREELNQILNMIELSGRKLINYTSELVSNSMEQGETKLIIDDVVMDDLIQDLIDIYNPLANAKGININTHLSTPGTFKLDSEKFKLIVSNLLSNALKFCHEGDSITLDVKITGVEEKTLFLYISDTGIGIPAAHLPTIFEKDEDHQRQGTKGEISTGMGLPIVKKYVELHNGEIKVESIEGMGTTFHINIPENVTG
ncbi:GAF domain-containing sensor histidine kinase [Gracilimonas amylolytica]|uniref:GAF domain-containing sensor histidine kinase n=1 Tax=Gracilimonas amylolytica TaxID=1749045 RepID=UPI000CD9F796|nr:GAF domain-containing sensor histidine kinase [Gracilimonas amylolytica]